MLIIDLIIRAQLEGKDIKTNNNLKL